MKKTGIIIVLALLFGLTTLAEAQIVVTSTTASTIHLEKNNSGREQGFVVRPEFGIGLGYAARPFLVDINGTIVYQFNPFFSIGGGLGYDYNDLPNEGCSMAFMPLFINARAYFCDKTWSPFFDLKIRSVIPLTKHVGYYYGSYFETYPEGISYTGTLGVQHKYLDLGLTGGYLDIHKDLGGMILTFSIAYNFQFK